MSSPDQARNRATDPCNPSPDRSQDPPSSSSANEDANQDPANFKKDALGNTVQKGSVKDQLDAKAREEWVADVKRERGEGEGEEKGVVDKVLSQIPVVNSLLGKMETEKPDKSEERDETHSSEAPRRPEHDVQVEQFLRGQYHSRSGNGMPEPGSSDA